jgi:hypothetical protein
MECLMTACGRKAQAVLFYLRKLYEKTGISGWGYAVRLRLCITVGLNLLFLRDYAIYKINKIRKDLYISWDNSRGSRLCLKSA